MTVSNKTSIGTLGSIFTVTNGVVGIIAATASVPGSMSAADKTKLDGVTAGAKLGGVTGATDNAILRADGTGGATAQSSLVTIDDTGSINIPTGQTYKVNGVALAASNVGAAATAHTHAEADVTNLTTDLAAKEPLLPSVSGQNGKYLYTDGSSKTWTEIPGNAFTSGSDTVTLPTNPIVGQIYDFVGTGSTWTVNANTGQTIRSLSTTGNRLNSGHNYASVKLVCIASNTWSVIGVYGSIDLVTV